MGMFLPACLDCGTQDSAGAPLMAFGDMYALCPDCASHRGIEPEDDTPEIPAELWDRLSVLESKHTDQH